MIHVFSVSFLGFRFLESIYSFHNYTCMNMPGMDLAEGITAMVGLVVKMLKSALAPNIEALLQSKEVQADKRPLVLVTLPRISVEDCEENYELLQEFITHEDDEPFRDLNIMEGAFRSIDHQNDYKLSGQHTAVEKRKWARWECDKTRVLWSFFLRSRPKK